MGKLVKLNPYLSETIWGGEKIKKIKNIDSINPIGESWEISTLTQGSSMIGDKKLSDLCSLNYLVKIIDTAKNLSIQVHPDEEYAKEHENSKGKTECWIILEADENAGIYLGFKEGVTKKEFFTAVKNNLEVNEYLNFYSVKKGDFFYIPAGTIHAIGENVTICEVQQSSGITYRVWDWNRVGIDGKPRELHVEKAGDVLNFSQSFFKENQLKNKKDLFQNFGVTNLIQHEDFKAQLIKYPTGKDIELRLNEKDSVLVLEGRVSGDIELNEFEAAISLEAGLVSIKAQSELSILLVSE